MSAAGVRAGALLSCALLLAAGRGAAETVLRVCDDIQDPRTLDPQKEFSEKNHILLQQINEGLVRFDPAGNIEPALAVSWERTSPTVVRFKLREGVSFHDGEPFDAEAVRFSVKRILDPATGFPGLSFINTIVEARVVDARTVDVVTSIPDGILMRRLAFQVPMVPPGYTVKKGTAAFIDEAIGTGPFRFARWERGKQIVLEANPDYWDKGYPKAGRLVFRFIPEDKQVAALLAGDIDILTSLPGTRTFDVQDNAATRVLKKPTFYTIVGNFNTARKPFADKRLREAVNLAVDRDALVRYDVFGNGVPIGTVSFPGEFGHNDKIKPYPYDPKRARQLLKEAGYPDGLDLDVLMKGNAQRTGGIIAKQLARIGIRMKTTVMSDSEIFKYMADKGRWDMMISDCPDPMYHAFFIRTIFLYGKSPFSLSADAGIDSRLETMTQTIDLDKQRALSEELDSYIHDEYLAFPTYQRLRTYGLRKGVAFSPYLSGVSLFYSAHP